MLCDNVQALAFMFWRSTIGSSSPKFDNSRVLYKVLPNLCEILNS